jgi:hypothetical protein
MLNWIDVAVSDQLGSEARGLNRYGEEWLKINAEDGRS